MSHNCRTTSSRTWVIFSGAKQPTIHGQRSSFGIRSVRISFVPGGTCSVTHRNPLLKRIITNNGCSTRLERSVNLVFFRPPLRSNAARSPGGPRGNRPPGAPVWAGGRRVPDVGLGAIDGNRPGVRTGPRTDGPRGPSRRPELGLSAPAPPGRGDADHAPMEIEHRRIKGKSWAAALAGTVQQPEVAGPPDFPDQGGEPSARSAVAPPTRLGAPARPFLAALAPATVRVVRAAALGAGRATSR